MSDINPIIVTGAPYSGTSVVARILQTRLGVMMDEGPIRTDENKPLGYYEDRRLLDINKVACAHYLKRRTEGKEGKLPLRWATEFAAWLVERANRFPVWGWKDPAGVGLIKYQKPFFGKPTWIVCRRRDEQVIKSQVEKHGYPERMALKGLAAYNEIIEEHLNGRARVVDLAERRSEEDIESELKDIIDGSY